MTRTAAPMVHTADSVIVPAGRYRLGDPCYSVASDLWMTWLEAADYKTEQVMAATLDGHAVIGLSTMYGDGEYPATDGRTYCVDAGMIGLVHEAVADRTDLGDDDRLGSWVTFEAPVLCTRDEETGALTFGHISIETGDGDGPDDEDDEQWGWGDESDDEDY